MHAKDYDLVDVVAAAIYDSSTDSKSFWQVLESSDEFDYALATEIIEYINTQHLIRELIGKNDSEFDKKILQYITNPSCRVPFSHLPIMKYVTKLWGRYKDDELMRDYAILSNYTGEVGERIQTSLTIIKCKQITYDFGSFILSVAVDEFNNLYKFSPKNMLTDGTVYTLKAKIKNHSFDSYINAKVTSLHYVKIDNITG